MQKNHLRGKVARQPLPQSVSFSKDTPTTVFNQLLSVVFNVGVEIVVSDLEKNQRLPLLQKKLLIAMVNEFRNYVQKQPTL